MNSETESSPASGGTARRAIVDVVVAVAGGAILKFLEPLIPTKWGPWPQRVTTVLAVIAGLYAGYAALRWGVPHIRQWHRERRVQAQLKGPVLHLCTEFSEATTQNFTRGAASILYSLTDAKTIDARSHNQCLAHVGTLWAAATWIASDVKDNRLTAWNGLRRLIGLHGDYLRLCCALADAVSAVKQGHVQRAWDDIRDHANAISRKLSDLEQSAQFTAGLSGPRTYLQSVPRAH